MELDINIPNILGIEDEINITRQEETNISIEMSEDELKSSSSSKSSIIIPKTEQENMNQQLSVYRNKALKKLKVN